MPKTTERIWLKITLRDNHDIQTTYGVLKFPIFFTVDYCDAVTLSDN